MNTHRGYALLGALLLVVACGDPAEPPPDGELEVGVAAVDGTGFVSVADGAEVELVPGAQGGFHVWLNLSVYGAEGALYVSRTARRVEDDALILRAPAQRLDVPGDAMVDWWQPDNAAPAFMCPSPIGLSVFDREIYFEVTLENADGEVVATDDLILTPRCPAGDQNAFCLSICSG